MIIACRCGVVINAPPNSRRLRCPKCRETLIDASNPEQARARDRIREGEHLRRYGADDRQLVKCNCDLVLSIDADAQDFQCPQCRVQLIRGGEACIYDGIYGPYKHFAPYTPPSTAAHWRLLHAYAWTAPKWTPELAAEWLNYWIDTIPSYGCKCREHFAEILAECPPRLSSRLAFIRWSIEVHNRVNELPNLRKPLLSFRQAMEANGLGKPRDCGQQPVIDSFVAVTALSALDKHREVQPRCLDSWRRFGLEVWAVNTPTEIEMLRPLYPQVSRWIESWDQGAEYSWPTQRINAIFRAVTDRPFLMLNSDIEIHGRQRRLLDVLDSGSVGVGLRWNYDGDWRSGRREGWGIDAFLVRPEQVADLPEMPFAIGRPMWDYWIPYHFESSGIPMTWIGEPLFFHESHPVHWSQHDLDQGRNWLRNRYGDAEDWYHVRSRWPFHGR